jgi:hypothetical protein
MRADGPSGGGVRDGGGTGGDLHGRALGVEGIEIILEYGEDGPDEECHARGIIGIDLATLLATGITGEGVAFGGVNTVGNGSGEAIVARGILATIGLPPGDGEVEALEGGVIGVSGVGGDGRATARVDEALERDGDAILRAFSGGGAVHIEGSDHVGRRGVISRDIDEGAGGLALEAGIAGEDCATILDLGEAALQGRVLAGLVDLGGG